MYDVLIIGSGPAGLSAAVYASRENLNFAVIENQSFGAGQITNSGRVDNYLGFYGIDGFELSRKFREHADFFGVKFISGEVSSITKRAEAYSVFLSGAGLIESKAVIYAAGTSPCRLEIEGEKEFFGRGVSYCAVCDASLYRGKTVAVIGGGDTALQDAVLLAKFAEKVYVIHRRDTFRANMNLQKKAEENPKTKFILNAVAKKISGEKTVKSVLLDVKGKETEVSVDGVFIAIGNLPNTKVLNGLVKLDERGYIIAGEDGVTCEKGFFAAGDVRAKPLRQVVCAASDGANCVYSLIKYLNF